MPCMFCTSASLSPIGTGTISVMIASSSLIYRQPLEIFCINLSIRFFCRITDIHVQHSAPRGCASMINAFKRSKL